MEGGSEGGEGGRERGLRKGRRGKGGRRQEAWESENRHLLFVHHQI